MLIPIVWLILVIGAGVFVALRHPTLAANLSSGIAIGLLALWLVASILGLLTPVQQGPQTDLASRDTAMHRISAHVIVIAAWSAFLWTAGVSAARGIRDRALLKTILEVGAAFAILVFVLLSAFTGYLNRPPETPGSYLRFHVLHRIAAPILGTVATLVFCAAMERARRAVRHAHAKNR